ncbi:hypothetical protein ASE14_09545 [Agromyces sp. Root81]|uniref:hypothetical protein n=1 Tax=Agromyces sp. Root81 TaxID=1736601 RepID=UPI0006FE1985|nr:hypothetical protein [Agromyces sp. Root81]KRC61162.1 hypothetical protein ASE14_09545 [Agromyces sp. Root81]
MLAMRLYFMSLWVLVGVFFVLVGNEIIAAGRWAGWVILPVGGAMVVVAVVWTAYDLWRDRQDGVDD